MAVQRVTITVVDEVAGTGEIQGDLVLPDEPRGLVIFAHGSGSSRHSPRNRMVASVLNDASFGALLFDLLTPAEEEVDLRTRELRFDIRLLTDRLLAAIDAVGGRPDTAQLPLGLFGASTGAAAALIAAAERADQVRAVVSRGGRPDLAAEALPAVRAPTLLVVGGLDDVVIGLNRDAASRMTCEHDVAIVPGATHLFEELGTLEEVSRLAIGWFERHL